MNKTVKVLSTAALAATLVVPVAAPAFAATYSVSNAPAVQAGQTQKLGSLQVEFDSAQLTSNDYLIVRLPSDFDFGFGTGTVTVNGDGDLGTAGTTKGNISLSVGTDNAFDNLSELTGAVQVEALAKNELKIKFIKDNKGVTPNFNGGKRNGYFYINFNNVSVPGGYSGEVKATIVGSPNSPFNDNNVVIATVGSGSIASSVDSVKTITTSNNEIDTLRLKEDRPGAFETNKTIKYKLPTGYKWTYTSTPGAANATYSELGASKTVIPAANFGEVAGTGSLQQGEVSFYTTDDGRTLVVENTGGRLSTTASYLMIKGLGIKVDDETVTKTGDIEATISGSATSTANSLVVARYGDYGTKVYAVGDPKEVVAGASAQKLGSFAIEESVAGSLVPNRTITLQLVGKAKWVKMGTSDSEFAFDASQSKNTGSVFNPTSDVAVIGNAGDTLRITIKNPTSGNNPLKAVMKYAKVDVSPEAEGDIKVVAGGTAGVTGEMVLGKVTKPVTATVDGELPTIAIGEQAQAIGDITITENTDGAIDAAKAGTSLKSGYRSTTVGTNTIYYIDANSNGTYEVGTDTVVPASEALSNNESGNTLAIEFPYGVTPTVPTNVTVTEGDLVLQANSARRYVGSNGHWYVAVDVKSTSSKPSKVKFSGIKVTTDRTVPEGPLTVKVGGSALVQTLDSFPGATTVASADVAKIGTPAPKDTTAANVVFKLGSKSFTVDGKEVQMDVQPLVKWDRAFLPVRFAANALGVSDNNIVWDDKTQTATIIKGDRIVVAKVGSKQLMVNGAPLQMDVPVFRSKTETNNRVVLPIRYLSIALGADIDWNAQTGEIVINPKK